MEEEGGKEIPSTVSEKGSLNPPARGFTVIPSSWEDIDPAFGWLPCFPLLTPILEGFLLRTFDRGLSMVDADEPETREGVLVFPVTSSFGSRDEVTCCVVLENDLLETGWEASTVGVVLPERPLIATVFGTGTL